MTLKALLAAMSAAVTSTYNRNPKLWSNVAKVTGAVILLIIVFMAGRLSRPDSVKIQEKVVTQIQTKIEYKDREVIKVVTVHVKDTNENLVKDTTTTKKPDGTVVTVEHEHLLEHDKDASSVNSTTNREVTQNTSVAETQTDVKTKEITNNRPGWLVGPMVGVNFRSLTGPVALTSGPLAFGVDLNRHLIGPIWGGVWGLSSGAAGIKLELELP